jgi:integrase
MLNQGKGAWAVNNLRKYLFPVWRHAASRGRIDRPPNLKPLRVHRGAPDAWTIDEMKRMLAVADNWWRALLLVGYWTLQRRRALFSIPVANIDLTGRWIDFPPAAMKAGVGIRCRVGGEAVVAIRHLAPCGDGLLFHWTNEDRIYSEFREILRRAGVRPSQRKNGLFHKLRRTGATHAVIRGGMRVVCDLLGQSDVYVTKRYIDKTQLPGHDVTELLPMLMDDGTNPRGPDHGDFHEAKTPTDES